MVLLQLYENAHRRHYLFNQWTELRESIIEIEGGPKYVGEEKWIFILFFKLRLTSYVDGGCSFVSGHPDLK